ncbi:MAG: IS3 family transposase [Rhodanobacteraceae bacterium]|nr:IS3 family transposase [Rhodanobacteraceae bacterium]MBP9155910.1 IS3 family transposase [Xanthomonadales bacterium]
MQWAMTEKTVTQRRACRVFGQSRCTQRRECRGRVRIDSVVDSRLLALASAHGGWGCPQLHLQLRAEGHRINHKRTARLYREHGLSLRRRRRRRLPERVRTPLLQPIEPNYSWSLDFMHDALASGRPFRTLNVIDDYARDILAIEIGHSLPGMRVVRVLEHLCELHGRPTCIRSDNGPEFRSVEVQKWAERQGITWNFIEPGEPAQNAYIERFNGTYRHEVLDANLFDTQCEVRQLTNEWMEIYNGLRIHSAIGNLPPRVFKQRWQQRNTSLLLTGVA